MVRDRDRELKMVNDAIQYWKGFVDALAAVKEEKIADIDKQIEYGNGMLDTYKERLRELRKNGHRR